MRKGDEITVQFIQNRDGVKRSASRDLRGSIIRKPATTGDPRATPGGIPAVVGHPRYVHRTVGGCPEERYRSIVRIILKRDVALTACGTFAGNRIASPS